jgi:two-component system sensor histidine kinase CpxA
MFLKIFLSFWLTVGVFAVAQEAAARLSRTDEHQTLAMVRAVVDDARDIPTAFERRGPSGARDAVEAFERRRGLFADLLKPERSSMTGRAVRPAEIEVARLADRIAAAGFSQAAVNQVEGLAAQQVVTSGGERLTLIVGLPRRTGSTASRALLVSSPIRLAFILAIGGVFCFVVARHLTQPIVALSAAANALADGRLHTRVGRDAGQRRDELGGLARDFDRMADRIEGLVAGQRRLLGDVSHELRSPLTRLTVALGLARRSSPQDLAEYFTRIETEADRLDRLIEQLLTLSRIESGADVEPRAPFDLSDVVQQVVGDADFEARASGKRVTLLGCEPAAILGMAELMRSAVENVVRNAIRHSRPNTSIDVALRVDGSATACIAVRDYGAGVPPAMLPEIFKPFWRGHGTADAAPDGAGLGLAISDRIVRMHGGRVSATNAEGGGLVVTIVIPRTT